MMQLSVAIVTRNRPESLRQTLRSLREQTLQPHEVIVADDSDERRRKSTAYIAEEFGCDYREGPKRGLYANRNFAANSCDAHGTHVRTMDDDHRFAKNHLATCWQAVRSDPSAIWTTGERAHYEEGKVDIADRANQLCSAGVGERISNLTDNWGISDGSTIYPLAIFRSGQRMVETFGYGSSYLEFGIYCYRLGWRSKAIPETYVDHYTSKPSVPNEESIAFASICFNVYFRPSFWQTCRHSIFHPRRYRSIPALWRLAEQRWSRLPASDQPHPYTDRTEPFHER